MGAQLWRHAQTRSLLAAHPSAPPIPPPCTRLHHNGAASTNGELVSVQHSGANHDVQVKGVVEGDEAE